jgi:hypothetical protein
MLFQCVSIDALEIGKMYKIKRYVGKRCVLEKGIFVTRSDSIVYFKVNLIHPFDDRSIFYEMIPQKHKIQEAMEARAFKQIIHTLIEYY